MEQTRRDGKQRELDFGNLPGQVEKLRNWVQDFLKQSC
jgi:hypothetical protein